MGEAAQHWCAAQQAAAEGPLRVLGGLACTFRYGAVLASQRTVIVTLERDVYVADKMIFKTQKGIFTTFLNLPILSLNFSLSLSDTRKPQHTEIYMLSPKQGILHIFFVDLQNLQKCISQVSRTSMYVAA